MGGWGQDVYRNARRDRRTVDLIQPGLLGDRRCSVLVKRAPVPRDLELAVDVDLLVAEDW